MLCNRFLLFVGVTGAPFSFDRCNLPLLLLFEEVLLCDRSCTIDLVLLKFLLLRLHVPLPSFLSFLKLDFLFLFFFFLLADLFMLLLEPYQSKRSDFLLETSLTFGLFPSLGRVLVI